MTEKWHENPAMRRAFWITAVVVVMGIVAYGVWKLNRPMRALALAKQAQVLLQEGDLTGAVQAAWKSRALAPNSAECSRALALVWSQMTPSQSYVIWEQVVRLSNNAPEDVQNYTLSLIVAGDLPKAKEQLDALLARNPDEKTRLIEIQYLIAAMRPAEALQRTLLILDKSPRSEGAWMLYAGLASAFGGKEKESFVLRLQQIAEDPSNLGLWACLQRLLLADDKDLQMRARELLLHPGSTRRTILQVYQVYRARQKMPFKVIREKISPLFNTALAGEKLELANFYISIGDGDGALLVISPKFALESAEGLELYLRALALARRSEAIIEILEVKGLKLPNYTKELWRARAYANLGEKQKSGAAWTSALAAAGDDSAALSAIAFSLSSTGDWTELDEVMPRLLKVVAPLERPLHYQSWFHSALVRRDAVKIYTVLEKMSTEYPDNSGYKNDFIYYSLLLNKKGDWVKEAYGLAKRSPSVAAHRVVLALALLKAGQPVKAEEFIVTAQVGQWDFSPIGWQLVRAAIFKANGKPAPEVSKADLALPEERALLEGVAQVIAPQQP